MKPAIDDPGSRGPAVANILGEPPTTTRQAVRCEAVAGAPMDPEDQALGARQHSMTHGAPDFSIIVINWNTGEVFDSSWERGEPATFSTTGVKSASTRACWASCERRPTTSGTFPVGGLGGGSKPSIGIPAVALTMNAFQIGAARVPPNTEVP